VPPFVDTVTLKNGKFYFCIVDIYIRIYLCYIMDNIILFPNILLRYNTLFTDRIKSILSITGIILSVFLGPDKHLQVFESLIAVQSVTSEDHLSSHHTGNYVLLTANKSPS
jgi:hypothetical protein